MEGTPSIFYILPPNFIHGGGGGRPGTSSDRPFPRGCAVDVAPRATAEFPGGVPTTPRRSARVISAAQCTYWGGPQVSQRFVALFVRCYCFPVGGQFVTPHFEKPNTGAGGGPFPWKVHPRLMERSSETAGRVGGKSGAHPGTDLGSRLGFEGGGAREM